MAKKKQLSDFLFYEVDKEHTLKAILSGINSHRMVKICRSTKTGEYAIRVKDDRNFLLAASFPVSTREELDEEYGELMELYGPKLPEFQTTANGNDGAWDSAFDDDDFDLGLDNDDDDFDFDLDDDIDFDL